MTTSSTLLLVHAAWHGPWCWSALVPALNERGVAVRTVQLTSQGTDPAAVGDLYRDVDAVCTAAAEIDGPVTLLGHSYGGVVITQAGSQLDNVNRMIYLSAFVPDAGESMRALTATGEPPPWLQPAEGLLHVLPGWGRKVFYSDAEPDVAEDAESRLLPQAAASFGQPVSAAGWRSVRSLYIVCTEDRSIPAEVQRLMAARVGAQVDLRADHSPFLSQPERLAGLLHEQL